MARKKNAAALTGTGLPGDYAAFLESLKTRVRQAQTKAMLSVNRELIQLYWDIGRQIAQRQEQEGWGKSVVDRLAGDIQKAFPGIQGFSPLNVWRMRAFYLAYHDLPANLSQAATESGKPILSQAATELPVGSPPHPVSEIPWGHNQVLLFKLKDPAERLWYAAKTLAHGWSRAVLTVQIESELYRRQGKAISNFATTLPAPPTSATTPLMSERTPIFNEFWAAAGPESIIATASMKPLSLFLIASSVRRLLSALSLREVYQWFNQRVNTAAFVSRRARRRVRSHKLRPGDF